MINLHFPALTENGENQDSVDLNGSAEGSIGSGKPVLVVEDDPRGMRASKARMTALGFACLMATSGNAAWDIVKERDDIALVFADLVMPGVLSGHDLALRVTAQKPSVRVLMTSGFSDAVLRGGRVRGRDRSFGQLISNDLTVLINVASTRSRSVFLRKRAI